MCRPDFSSSQTPRVNKQQQQQRRETLQRGFYWGAASVALWLVATNMSMPYTQDKRNSLACDSMCQGSMNSARSTLTLMGATVVGRLSDAPWLDSFGGGRRVCLMLGLVATAIGLVLTSQASSLLQLWQSLLPQVLQQNSSVVRALFSDYHAQLDSSSTQQASTAGLLGLVGGLAMMLGPVVGSSLLDDIHQATNMALVVLFLAAICVGFAPSIPTTSRPNRNENKASSGERPKTHFWSMLDVPSARSPPALFLLACRLLSTLSFHMFAVVSTPSLKQRFDFGPPEYGQFFSFIGFCFAISQYVCPVLLQSADNGYRKQVFVMALAVVGVGRYLALGTTDVYAMYAYYAVTVLATGAVATLFATDTSQVAAPEEAGAFFGVVATIESGAGMIGPLLGGTLAKWSSEAPLVATTSLTALVGAMVWLGYEPIVLTRISKKKTD